MKRSCAMCLLLGCEQRCTRRLRAHEQHERQQRMRRTHSLRRHHHHHIDVDADADVDAGVLCCGELLCLLALWSLRSLRAWGRMMG